MLISFFPGKSRGSGFSLSGRSFQLLLPGRCSSRVGGFFYCKKQYFWVVENFLYGFLQCTRVVGRGSTAICGTCTRLCEHYRTPAYLHAETLLFTVLPRSGSLQDSSAPLSSAQLSTTQHITAQHSTTQHSTAQHNTAQHSAAQHSTAQHSSAQHSSAQHSAAQHSSALHSTAQHSTAQHSTA